MIIAVKELKVRSSTTKGDAGVEQFFVLGERKSYTYFHRKSFQQLTELEAK